MRILHIINNTGVGGAETLLAALLNEWEDQHHVVVLEGPGALSDDIARAADTLTHIGGSRSSLSLVKMIRGVSAAIRAVRPDIIHSHLVQSDLVSILSGFGHIPRVTSIHVSSLEISDPLRSRLVAKLVGFLSFRFRGAIATSDKSIGYLDSLGYRCDRWVINNGTVRVAPVAYVQDPITFLSIARFHPVKGHKVLLQAFAQHHEKFPESRLVCAGPGVSLENLPFRSLVKSLNLPTSVTRAVEFVGPTRNIRGLHERSSALIISSVGNETFPMVGSEACMAGLPVLTTDVGNASDFAVVVEAVAKPASVSSLSDVLSWFSELAPIVREELARESYSRALERYDVALTAQRYTEVYKEILVRRRSAKTDE